MGSLDDFQSKLVTILLLLLLKDDDDDDSLFIDAAAEAAATAGFAVDDDILLATTPAHVVLFEDCTIGLVTTEEDDTDTTDVVRSNDIGDVRRAAVECFNVASCSCLLDSTPRSVATASLLLSSA
jgi:hypothetical protein